MYNVVWLFCLLWLVAWLCFLWQGSSCWVWLAFWSINNLFFIIKKELWICTIFKKKRESEYKCEYAPTGLHKIYPCRRLLDVLGSLAFHVICYNAIFRLRSAPVVFYFVTERSYIQFHQTRQKIASWEAQTYIVTGLSKDNLCSKYSSLKLQ